MAFFIDNTGARVDAPITPEVYREAHAANLSVPQFINRKFSNADLSKGSAYQQILASEGLVLPGANPFGLRAATLQEVLEGRSGYDASTGSNTADRGTPFGSASRTLFPAALISMIEATMARDRTTDGVVFDQMIAMNMSIGSENFEQPVINYSTTGGPEQARSQRIAQLAEPPIVLKFTTADRPRRLGVMSIGAQFSDQALRASTLDIVALTMAKQFEVERDAEVYEFMSAIWTGDADLNVGAVSAVTSSALNGAATGGVMTHKAWLKFLARNRKYRKVNYVAGDIDTYLKVEGRTGRPGSNNYDPTLARIDPQAQAINVGFGNDVRWFIVDTPAEGGPIPANTVWALDSTKGIVKVTNTAAAYTANEAFAMSRSQALRIDRSEAVYRMFGDSELRAFDVLTID
jgi:hypothetical protein